MRARRPQHCRTGRCCGNICVVGRETERNQATMVRQNSVLPAASFDPHLVVLSGNEIGRQLPIGDKPVRLGRGEECEVSILSEKVSRHHATVLRRGTRVAIRDENSTNGTYVNDERVTLAELKDGDRIRVGKTIIKYLAQHTVEVAAHRQLFDRANRDALTGAFNKRYFEEALDRETRRCLAEGRPLSLVALDLDHFKQVNDTHGHTTGDELLKRFGGVVMQALRGNDIFCRVGGEEFLVILPGAALAVGYVCGERLREQVEEHVFELGELKLRQTVSGGVAEYQPGEDLTLLRKRADERLYQAKLAGRNRVH